MPRTITSAERSAIIDAVARGNYGEPVYPHERVLVGQVFDAIAKMAAIDVESVEGTDDNPS
jgi:hypothetical protein